MRILLMLLLKKIWAEMKEPMLEYLRWTLEFLSWKSNMGFQLQPRNSEAREPTTEDRKIWFGIWNLTKLWYLVNSVNSIHHCVNYKY